MEEEQSNSLGEKKVCVRNFFLLKHIADDQDDKLNLVGTMIQNVFGTDKLDSQGVYDEDVVGKDICDKDNCPQAFHFGYRFNNLVADEDSGYAKVRRLERTKTATKATFQMSAPLDVDVVFDYFPFKAVTATLLVELSTCTNKDETQRIRPNLLLAKKDRRNNVSVQTPYLEDGDWVRKKSLFSFRSIPQVLWNSDDYDSDDDLDNEGESNDTETRSEGGSNNIESQSEGESNKISGRKKIEALKDKMDKMKSYDFITPFPKVEYLYDENKKYCPKCKLTFYLVEVDNSKLVEILAPVFLISILNTLNVINTDTDIDIVDYIANSATLALTAAFFILPNIYSKANRTKSFTNNTAYVILVFLGLSLSSFPEALIGTRACAFVGMILLWSSFFMPLVSCFLFWVFQNKISPKKGIYEINDFTQSGDYKPFNYEKDINYKEHFLLVEDDATKKEKDGLYKSKTWGKVTHIKYRKMKRVFPTLDNVRGKMKRAMSKRGCN